MEHIKDILEKTVELLGPQTSEDSGNMTELVRCDQFQTFNDPQLEQMKSAAERFIADILSKKSPYWISLIGSSGAGKTMLGKWIYGQFKAKLDWEIDWPATERTRSPARPYGEIIRHRGDYTSWRRVANLLREGEHRMFDDLCAVRFLFVDDIGAEYGSPFVDAKLYELCSRREGKWTIFTANLSLADIENRIDARVASRMIRHGSVVVDVDVKDFNLR